MTANPTVEMLAKALNGTATQDSSGNHLIMLTSSDAALQEKLRDFFEKAGVKDVSVATSVGNSAYTHLTIPAAEMEFPKSVKFEEVLRANSTLMEHIRAFLSVDHPPSAYGEPSAASTCAELQHVMRDAMKKADITNITLPSASVKAGPVAANISTAAAQGPKVATP